MASCRTCSDAADTRMGFVDGPAAGEWVVGNAEAGGCICWQQSAAGPAVMWRSWRWGCVACLVQVSGWWRNGEEGWVLMCFRGGDKLASHALHGYRQSSGACSVRACMLACDMQTAGRSAQHLASSPYACCFSCTCTLHLQSRSSTCHALRMLHAACGTAWHCAEHHTQQHGLAWHMQQHKMQARKQANRSKHGSKHCCSVSCGG